MSVYSILTSFYGHLYGRPHLPFWILTPARFISRKLANKYVPVYFRRTQPINRERVKLKDKRIIVSLTSFPARLDNLWIVIQCLLRQTCQPDKIILWLSQTEIKSSKGIPESLQSLVNEKFEIRIVSEAYRSHTKYFYALQEFSNDIVITVDDDLFYPPKILETLIDAYIENPDCIIANIVKARLYEENNSLKSYNSWPHYLKPGINSSLFLLGVGGVLYPPSVLRADAFNPGVFMDICKLADDVWLNAMASVNNTQVYHTKWKSILMEIHNSKAPSLKNQNVAQNLNDIQIDKVREYCKKEYGQDPFAMV